MPPNTQSIVFHEAVSTEKPKLPTSTQKIVWPKVITLIYMNIGMVLGLYYAITSANIKTLIFANWLGLTSGFGVTAGAHRLWAHRSYKAILPYRIILMVLQTITFQKDLYNWVRDHRLHHKYSDTEYDPHNAKRGFFYSHMGWLMLTKPQHVVEKGKSLDLSDLEADPVVKFQRKYYWYLCFPLSILIPVLVPWYFWNEDLWISWNLAVLFRICILLHCTCLVNSAAHIFGNKPYDRNISPNENHLVAMLTNGEGYHNYHHAFPWDYKTAEFGVFYGNYTTRMLGFFEKLGVIYDLRTVDENIIKKKIEKTGDGTWTGKSEPKFKKVFYPIFYCFVILCADNAVFTLVAILRVLYFLTIKSDNF